MPKRISEIRQAVESQGQKWTPELYHYAVGRGALVDENRPSANIGEALLAAPNAALSGITMGLTDRINPVTNISTGVPVLDAAINKVAVPTAQGLGMALPLAFVPEVAVPRAIASGNLAARTIGRMIPAAAKFAAYDAGRGAIEGFRNAPTPDQQTPDFWDRVLSAAGGASKGAVRGGTIGGAMGALHLPERLGGRYTSAGLGLGALTAAEGGSPTDIAGAAVSGPVMEYLGVRQNEPKTAKTAKASKADIDLERRIEEERAKVAEMDAAEIVRSQQRKDLVRVAQAKVQAAAEQQAAEMRARQEAEAANHAAELAARLARRKVMNQGPRVVADTQGVEERMIRNPQTFIPPQGGVPAPIPEGPKPPRPVVEQPYNPLSAAPAQTPSTEQFFPEDAVPMRPPWMNAPKPQGAKPPRPNAPGSDLYLGTVGGGVQQMLDSWRTPKNKPPVPDMKPVKNNPIDAAALAFKRTLDPKAWIDGLPDLRRGNPFGNPQDKPTYDAAPEVWAGVLMADKVAKPAGETFDLPMQEKIPFGGKVIVERKTGNRFYVGANGQHYKMTSDVLPSENAISSPDAVMAGVGGGRYAGPKGSENPAVSHVKIPSELAIRNATSRAKDQSQKALEIFRRLGVSDKNRGDMERVGDLYEKLNNDSDLAEYPGRILLRPGVKEIVRGSKVDPLKLIEAAQQTKKLIMDDLEFVNAVRAKMGMDPIGVQEFYRPKLRHKTRLEKELGLGAVSDPNAADFEFGLDEIGVQVPRGAKVGVSNPRAMPRQEGLEYPEERAADALLANYFHNMSMAAFMEPSIANARAVAKVYKAVGLNGAAANIDGYANQVLAGQENALAHAVPKYIKGPLRRMAQVQSSAVLGSFRFGITQASGQAVQVARHGPVNLVKGLRRVMIDKPTTDWIKENVIAMQNKLDPHGGITQQDMLEFRSALNDKAKWHEYFMQHVESNLSWLGAGGAYEAGIKKGFAPGSRELADYISTEVRNIQGGYSRSERAGLVRSPEVGILLSRFQGYSLQLASQVRSLLLGKTGFGRTGYYRSEYAGDLSGDAGLAKRGLVALRWIAAMEAMNTLTGFTNWSYKSFVPFASQFGVEDDRQGKFKGWTPAQFYKDLSGGITDFVKYNNGMKLRKFVLRWRIPLGIQADYAIDGYNAWKAHGHYIYEVRDGVRRKKLLFRVGDDELLTAMMMGPYATKGGREYIQRRDKSK